jgi:hypothetical protein
LKQGNDFFWVCEWDGNRMEIPTNNGSTMDTVYNIFGEDGLYFVNSTGQLEKVGNDEALGVNFSIYGGGTTNVTLRMNLIGLPWVDLDQSGDWSDGDYVGNPTLPPGITTMADFIVTYN